MPEVWKPVELPDLRWPDGSWKYFVSNMGNVKRSCGRSKFGRTYSERLCGVHDGVVDLCTVDGSIKYIAVSMLVATAFIPNPFNSKVVYYKDGNRFNSCVENLTWESAESVNGVGRNISPVIQFDIAGNVVGRFGSIAEVCRVFGFSQSAFRQQLTYKNARPYHGYIWRFASEKVVCDGVEKRSKTRRSGRLQSTEIRQYDENGVLVAVYRTCTEAAKAIGVKQPRMSAWLSVPNKLHSGYYWRKASSDEFSSLNGLAQHSVPTVLQYSEDHILLNEFATITEASRATGVVSSNISAVCRREYGYNQAGGYIWRYSDDDEFS